MKVKVPFLNAVHSFPFFGRSISSISSYAIIPRENISAFLRSGILQSGSLFSNSFARYLQSPSGTSPWSLFINLANPRSPSLYCPLELNKTLSGFRSRWTMSLLCNSYRPRHVSRRIFLISVSVKYCSAFLFCLISELNEFSHSSI